MQDAAKKDPWANLQKVIQIRKRRIAAGSDSAKPNHTPFTIEEQAAFSVIRTHLMSRAAQPEKVKDEMDALPMAEKHTVLDAYTGMTLVMGVPYKWFVINAVISLIVFIVTQSFSVLMFCTPVIHAVSSIYHWKYGAKERGDKLQKLITEGIT